MVFHPNRYFTKIAYELLHRGTSKYTIKGCNSYSLETTHDDSSAIALLHSLKICTPPIFGMGVLITSITHGRKSAILCRNLELHSFR